MNLGNRYVQEYVKCVNRIVYKGVENESISLLINLRSCIFAYFYPIIKFN
jgi:hypothetical protein